MWRFSLAFSFVLSHVKVLPADVGGSGAWMGGWSHLCWCSYSIFWNYHCRRHRGCWRCREIQTLIMGSVQQYLSLRSGTKNLKHLPLPWPWVVVLCWFTEGSEQLGSHTAEEGAEEQQIFTCTPSVNKVSVCRIKSWPPRASPSGRAGEGLS